MNKKIVLITIIAFAFLSIIGVSVFGSVPVNNTPIKVTSIDLIIEEKEYVNNGKKIVISKFDEKEGNQETIKILLEKGVSKAVYELYWKINPDNASTPDIQIVSDKGDKLVFGSIIPTEKSYYKMEIEFNSDVKSFYIKLVDKDSQESATLNVIVEVDNKQVENPPVLPE